MRFSMKRPSDIGAIEQVFHLDVDTKQWKLDLVEFLIPVAAILKGLLVGG